MPIITPPAGSSGGTGTGEVFDENGELVNPGVTTGSFIFNGAGPPLAGSCPHERATYRDTSSGGDVYVCFGVGQNWYLDGQNEPWRVPDSIATCTAAIAGTIRYKVNPAGVADQFLICTGLPDGQYYWIGPPELVFSVSSAGEVCEATPAADAYWWSVASPTEAAVLSKSRSGYYTNLVNHSTAQITSPQVMTVALRKDTTGTGTSAADTALTCQQASSATDCSSSAVVHFNANDLVGLRETCTTGGAAARNITQVTFYPD